MKVEFLAAGSEMCPLLRLYDWRPGEVAHLRGACLDLADGRIGEFLQHDRPWVEAVGALQFLWRVGPKDVGVRMPSAGEPFVWTFTEEGWREVEEKLRPFTDGSGGFNWLTSEGDVNVLISRDGLW